MATLSVPDITLRPAAVGSKGARALQRLDIDNQRRARMLNTLQQMGFDKPSSGTTRRNSDLTPGTSRNNSADSVRRSRDPNSSDDTADSLTPSKVNHGRRRSLMIESLGSLRNKGVSKPKSRQTRKSLVETLGAIADISEPVEDEDENTSNRLTLFPETPYRDLRSGRRRSLFTPGIRLSKSPRTSIEGADLFSQRASGDSLQIPVSRRRSRRGSRSPKPKAGYLSTGQDDDDSNEMDDAGKFRKENKVCMLD